MGHHMSSVTRKIGPLFKLPMASDRVFSAHMLHILLIQERITLVQTNSKVEAYTSYIRIPADAMTTHGMGMVAKADGTCE